MDEQLLEYRKIEVGHSIVKESSGTQIDSYKSLRKVAHRVLYALITF